MVKRSIEQEIRNKNFGAKRKFWKERRGQESGDKNSVYKEFLEIVGNGKPTGNVWKETIAVSATIWISVGKVHHQIRLKILSCSRVSENHRGPEVPEVRAPVVECRDGLARITLEELAKTHPVKRWHPPECLFYKNKIGCRFWWKVLFCTSSGWWTADEMVQIE